MAMAKSEDVKWEPCFGGGCPRNAFVTGAQDQGKSLFVARALHEGSMTPGKLHQDHNACYVSWGGKEHGKKEYEVLIQQPGLTWVRWSGGQIHPSAVVVGYERDAPLHSIKGKVNGVDVLGKYHSKYKTGYFPFGGKEHTTGMNGIEILCLHKPPKTGRHLDQEPVSAVPTLTRRNPVKEPTKAVSAGATGSAKTDTSGGVGKVSVQCPICMESLEFIKRSGYDLVSTVCGHIFCSLCLPESVRASGKCPTCRRTIGADDYHRIFI